MNTLKKLNDRLLSLQAKREADLSEIKAELASNERELAFATDLMNNTEDPEEFRKAREMIEARRSNIEFWKRKESKLTAVLPMDEYRDIKDEILIEYTRTLNNRSDKINKALGDLLRVMDETSEEIDYLSEMLERSGELAQIGYAQRKHIKFVDISNAIEDYWYKGFCKFFFESMGKYELLKKSGVIK